MAADKTVVFITGANTGIGFEAVKALLGSDKKTYHILLGSRSVDKGRDAVERAKAEFPSTESSVELVQIDVVSDESIEQARKAIEEKAGRVDCLINNAGGQFDADTTLSRREIWNKNWDLNVTSADSVTMAFVPLLLKSTDPRLLFITSGLSSLTEAANPEVGNAFNRGVAAGWPKPPAAFGMMAYRSAKTGLNMVMVSWAKILQDDGVKVWSVAPGFLATGLGGLGENMRKMGAGEPWLGGVMIKAVVEGERDDQVGSVVRAYSDPGAAGKGGKPGERPIQSF